MKDISIVSVLVDLALAYFAVAAAVGVFLALVAWLKALRRRGSSRVLREALAKSDAWMPPLSIAIPAYGEPHAVRETVMEAMRLGFPTLEVIVVGDTARRATFDSLLAAFDFRRCYRVYRRVVRCGRIRAVYVSAKNPRLLFVDKQEAGLADDLNAALNIAASPLFAYLETGTLLDPTLVRGLLHDWVEAPETLAMVGGQLRAAPEGIGALSTTAARLEHALPSGRGWTAIASAANGAGAFFIYRKRQLELAGGFSVRALNTRVDAPLRLFGKLRLLGISIRARFHPDRVAVERARPLFSSIRRSHAGLLDSLYRYGSTALRQGSASERLAVAYLFLFEVFGPLAELAAYIAMPIFFALGLIDGKVLTAAATLILGAPILRTGISTLCEVGEGKASARAEQAGWLVTLSLISPIWSHQANLWGRLLGQFDMLWSRGRKAPQFTALPRPVRAPASSLSAEIAVLPLGAPRLVPRPAPQPEPVFVAEEMSSPIATAVPPPPKPSVVVESLLSPETVEFPSGRFAPPPRSPAPETVEFPSEPAARAPVPVAPPRPKPVAPPPQPVAPTPEAVASAPEPVAPPEAPAREVREERSGLPGWLEDEPQAEEHHTGKTSMEMPAIQTDAGEEPLDMDVMDVDAATEATRDVGALISFGPLDAGKKDAVFAAMSRSPLFISLPDPQRHELLPFLSIGEAKSGQTIVREGEPIHALFMVVSGELEASSKSASPYVMGPGRTFGLISTAPSKEFALTVGARTNASLIAIKERDLPRVAELFPVLNLKAPETTVILPHGTGEGGEPLDIQPVDGPTAVRKLAADATEKFAITDGELVLRPVAPEEAHHVLAAVARSPIFCVLPTSKYDSLLPHFRLASVARDTTILKKGGPPTALFMVVKGELSVADEPIVLGPGQCVGVISTHPPEAFGSTIRASADSTVAVMSPDSVTELALLYPVLELSEKESDAIWPPVQEGTKVVDAAMRAILSDSDGAAEAAEAPPPAEESPIDAEIPFAPVSADNTLPVLRAMAKNPLFGVLSPADRSELISHFRVARLDPGARVLGEGKPVSALFLVVEGSFRFFTTDTQGAEYPLAKLEPGEMCGEMALLTGDAAEGTLQTDGAAVLAALPVKEFQKIAESLPVLGITLARVIAQRFARISASLAAQLQSELKGRLDHVPAAALVQAIDVREQSGTLFAQSGERSIVAEFQNGQLTEAKTDSGEGIGVFNQFMSWTRGSFKFVPAEAPAAPAAAPARPPLQIRSEPFSVKDPAAAAIALSRLPLFTGLEPDQISEVLRTTWKLYPEAGEVLVNEGKPSEALYVVGEGSFEEIGADGKVLSAPGPGECFGEMSILTDQPAIATVRAKTAGNVLAIPREPLVQLVARIPALGAALARALSGRLVKTTRAIDEQLSSGKPGRLESVRPAELIQVLMAAGQSGLLVVEDGEGTIDLDLIDGQVRDVRAGDLPAEEAFLRFLDLASGEFCFEAGRPDGPGRIDVDTMTLVSRGLQRHAKAAN